MPTDRTSLYRSQGFVHVPGLIPREVGLGFVSRLKMELERTGASLDKLLRPGPLLRQPAIELYGYHYTPLAAFHWGMSATAEAIFGEAVLPTYAYFRIYRQGDICRVHCDRHSCEHSLSLTLAYGDDVPWPLEVARTRSGEPYARADEAFRDEEQAVGVAMAPGDGVFYQGVHHHHGRTTPNPNRWSAHMFLHWVSRDGPYAEHAFDGQVPPERLEL